MKKVGDSQNVWGSLRASLQGGQLNVRVRDGNINNCFMGFRVLQESKRRAWTKIVTSTQET